ncbi:MAG: radical SAM protein [Candidatus Thermoplasmatota archaeon]|nr:radical SAM protein [Candidatus Thermoplasmatota archaeon]
MEVRMVRCRTALSPSRLPGLDWALNPYRGCAHSCAYCYAQDVTRFELARPWGDVLEVKTNIAHVLRKELQRKREGVVGVGTVTDPYQPAEERFQLTRDCLSVLRSKDMSASILTKSPLVLRDLGLLEGWDDVEVGLSIASMDERLSSVLEPGAPKPRQRMAALERLNRSGVRIYLMAAPIVPGLSDQGHSVSELVSRASDAGVRRIMWDAYNPKPTAHRRLRSALVSAGLLGRLPAAQPDLRPVRELFETECRAHAVDLVDAF